MSGPDLWVEGHHYGRRVLAADAEPWSKPAELGLFYRQLSDLLRPDVIELPLLPALNVQLAPALAGVADPQAAVSIITQTLGQDLRDRLDEGAHAVRGAGLRCATALALPGPDALLAALAPDAVSALDDDERDVLATALTDLVRTLARTFPARLVLHENSSQALDACDVLLNLARDYRLPVTLITDLPATQAPHGFECVMPAGAAAAAWRPGHSGQILSERLWDSPEEVDRASWSDAQVVRVAVPPRAHPEIVIRALAHLRPAR